MDVSVAEQGWSRSTSAHRRCKAGGPMAPATHALGRPHAWATLSAPAIRQLRRAPWTTAARCVPSKRGVSGNPICCRGPRCSGGPATPRAPASIVLRRPGDPSGPGGVDVLRRPGAPMRSGDPTVLAAHALPDPPRSDDPTTLVGPMGAMCPATPWALATPGDPMDSCGPDGTGDPQQPLVLRRSDDSGRAPWAALSQCLPVTRWLRRPHPQGAVPRGHHELW